MTELASMMNLGKEMVCLVHLYALEGAIRNIEFNSLSEDTKKELKPISLTS